MKRAAYDRRMERRPQFSGGKTGVGMSKLAEHIPSARTCQWIEGEAIARDFCGAPVESGFSYCSEHRRRAYRKEVGEVAS